MNIEQKAAATLLDKGIKVPVTAPLLLRLIGKKVIHIIISQPYLGTLYRISLLCNTAGINEKLIATIDEENAHLLYMTYGRQMAKIAAIAWLNGYLSGKLFGGIAGRWLLWHLKPIQLLTLMNVLVVLSNTKSFRNTIRLANDMIMTNPNLSQEVQGS